MPQMSALALKAMLNAERASSLGGNINSDLSSERTKAMEYYNGEMTDMPSAEGRSKAVSTDVADTIEGLLPPLVEIFAAGEEVVKFEAVGPEDVEAAQQETDYVNHVFMQKNPGFMVSYTFIKDGLQQKNGFVKVYWDKTEKEERETYLDQPDDAFMMLAQSPDTEIVEHTQKTGEDGQITHDVTLVKRKSYGCAKVVNIPPNEFGITKRARTIRDSTYCFHEPANVTEADLIAQGFDEAQVKTLPTRGSVEEQEEQARDTLNADETNASDSLNKAARLIKVIEHYVFMDYEGNGKPTLYMVTTGGNQMEVLRRDGKDAVDPVDVMPFASLTPIPVPHEFFGRSTADIVMDIQQQKTALLRGMLDNIYLANNQRHEIAESHSHERTLDDYLNNRPGAPVRVKTPGGILPIPNQFIGEALYPAFQYLDATREWRTGVTKQGQGIDANALQNQTATASNNNFTASQARQRLIGRVMAETGFRDMFILLHGCIRKNDRQINTVRLRNKWVEVDPRTWKNRDDMTINVGLGTGSKEQQIAQLTNIMGVQKEMMMARLPTVTPKNLYNTAAKLVEKSDLKTVEPYFTDPESQEGQQIAQAAQQQPDPEQMKMQFEQQKLQMEAQLAEKADQRKAQIEEVQAQADIATNQQKLEAEAMNNEREFQLKKELALFEAQLEQEKFNREEARKDREHSQKMELTREQHSQAMQAGAFKVAADREGHEAKLQQMKAKEPAE